MNDEARLTNFAAPRIFVIRHLGFLRHSLLHHSALTPAKCHDSSYDENIYQSDLEEEKPAEPHELIITKTGQRPADPHENENQDGDFCEEDCDVDQAEDPSVGAVRNSREMPATEE